MAKILKPCCILYKRKKKSRRQFDDEKYLASALFYNNLENFAMKSQQNLSVFCKTDKQCVCVHSIQTEKNSWNLQTTFFKELKIRLKL